MATVTLPFRFPWTKFFLGLGLLVALVWGLAWGKKQAADLARANGEIVVAQAQATRDSLALLATLPALDSANALQQRTALALASIGRAVAASQRHADSLHAADSAAVANAPPDSSGAAVGFWRGIAESRGVELMDVRSSLRQTRQGWHLDSLAWLAQRTA